MCAGTDLLNSSSGLVWVCEWAEGEDDSCSGFRLLEKACRCFTRRRTTSTCSSVGLKGSCRGNRSHTVLGHDARYAQSQPGLMEKAAIAMHPNPQAAKQLPDAQREQRSHTQELEGLHTVWTDSGAPWGNYTTLYLIWVWSLTSQTPDEKLPLTLNLKNTLCNLHIFLVNVSPEHLPLNLFTVSLQWP